MITSQQADLIIKALARLSTDDRIIVTAGTEYTKSTGFFLDVKEEGSVHYTTYGGQTNTEVLGKGYHPFRVVKIFNDTAVAISINF